MKQIITIVFLMALSVGNSFAFRVLTGKENIDNLAVLLYKPNDLKRSAALRRSRSGELLREARKAVALQADAFETKIKIESAGLVVLDRIIEILTETFFGFESSEYKHDKTLNRVSALMQILRSLPQKGSIGDLAVALQIAKADELLGIVVEDLENLVGYGNLE